MRRVTVSPSAVTVRFVLEVAALVGAKRTVTDCVAPAPVRVNEPPDTTLKGALTDAVPVTVPPRVFWIVKVCVAELPTGTPPKLTVPAGVTEKSICAVALALVEQALWLPAESTAVTATVYVTPGVRLLSRTLTVCPAGGVEVDDVTCKKVPPGHGVLDVP